MRDCEYGRIESRQRIPRLENQSILIQRILRIGNRVMN